MVIVRQFIEFRVCFDHPCVNIGVTVLSISLVGAEFVYQKLLYGILLIEEAGNVLSTSK